MKRRTALLGIGAAAGAAALYTARGRYGPLPFDGFGAAYAQQAAPEAGAVAEMSLGNPDAPVTLIEYASYTCPHCRNWHEDVWPRIKADFVDTGKIHFIYREVYFDRYGLWASVIARCAGADKFFGVTDLLYKGQRDWSRAGGGDPAAIADELRKIGMLVGMEADTVEACLMDRDAMQNLVAWYQQNAETDGITSTPSFVINGTTYQNMSYSAMSELLVEAGAV